MDTIRTYRLLATTILYTYSNDFNVTSFWRRSQELVLLILEPVDIF